MSNGCRFESERVYHVVNEQQLELSLPYLHRSGSVDAFIVFYLNALQAESWESPIIIYALFRF